MKWEEARTKLLSAAQGSALRMFSSPEGKVVLETLSKMFEGELVEKDKNGKVDENATLINVGAARVIAFLRNLAEPEGDRE
jgi:hypothetical protein